jgi:circadian clock protein KaiC
MKTQQITGMFTSLIGGTEVGKSVEGSQVGISSLMDTWLLLRNEEFNGERNRTVFVVKSRGMEHSNQVREFTLSSRGFDLREVYVGKDRVLTGTARVMQESQEQAEAELRRRNHERDVRRLAARQKAIESRIMSLTAQAEAEAAELDFAHARKLST